MAFHDLPSVGKILCRFDRCALIAHCRAIGFAILLMVASEAASYAFAQEQMKENLAKATAAEKAIDFDLAIKIYTAALNELSPTPAQKVELLRRRARVYTETKSFPQAESDLSAAISLSPDDYTLYIRRGYFYLERDRFDDALADFEAGSRISPKESFFIYGKGRVYSARREFDKAIESYTKAMELAPGVALHHLYRAEANLRLGRYKEALADYDRALATGYLLPDDITQLHFGRGYLYLLTDKYDLAIRELDAALNVDPNHLLGRRWRGTAHERLGHRQLALADYEYALKLKPDDKWTAERVMALRQQQ